MTEDMVTDYINKQAEEDGKDFQVMEWGTFSGSLAEFYLESFTRL